MKNKLFISLALATSFWASAQQKNTFLEASFWKTSPNINAIKAEITKGNSPSEYNQSSFDPVVLAINNDAPTETIKFLIEQPGNSVNKNTHDNRIYLHWAAYKGNLEIINYLIAKGSDINLEDSHGTTPIAFAAGNGLTNTAVYDAFFKAGIDPKKKYKGGTNLLLMAIPSDKNLALSNYFSSKGLSLTDTDSDGKTAFDYAARTGDLTLLKTLVQKGIKYTGDALIFAAQGSRRESNPIEVYQYLVDELKIKPTSTNKEGETVLHILARKPNQTEIINYFLAKGLDVNKADNEGNTVLMNAATNKEIKVIELLLAKSNLNAQNTKGESALTIAVKSGSVEAIELLLNKGANINVLDKDGNNLGFYLIQSYKPTGNTPNPFASKVKILQEKGLNLAAAQKDGNTLYHLAVVKNDIALLKDIASINIDINAKNKDGLTALHKAAMIGKDDILLKYLIANGAKKEITTEFDESAYSLAKENESLTKNKVSIEFLK